MPRQRISWWTHSDSEGPVRTAATGRGEAHVHEARGKSRHGYVSAVTIGGKALRPRWHGTLHAAQTWCESRLHGTD